MGEGERRGREAAAEDSREAGGPPRGAAEDEGGGRHSREVKYLREAQRKTRGRRAARKAEEARGMQPRGQGDTQVQYVCEHITDTSTGGTWASRGL